MKLVVNTETCDGHGQCLGAAPDLLAFGTNGQAKVIKDPLEEGDIEQAEDACYICPTQSLRIEP